jgi:hypothetical protein
MRSMVRTHGRSVIFVSHSMSTIEAVCDRVMWLEQGQCRMDDAPRRVIEAYREHIRERKHERREREQPATGQGSKPHERQEELPRIVVPAPAKRLNIGPSRGTCGGAMFEAIWLEEKDGAVTARIGAHRKFAIGCAVRFQHACEPVFGVRIVGADGAAVTAADTAELQEHLPAVRAGEERVVHWPIARGLPPGVYEVECWVRLDSGATGGQVESAIASLNVEGPPRIDAALNLVMRPSVGRAAHDR